MRKMFSRRSRLTRVGATALPFILLWAFVACLALCSDHTTGVHEESPSLSWHSISGSEEGDDCAIPASSFLLPQRQSEVTVPLMTVGSHATGHFSGAATTTISRVSPCMSQQSNLHHASDPPLERLGILRI